MGKYLPEQTIAFRIYHDGTDQIGVATIDLPELSYMTESLSGAGIAGEIDSPTLGMTESMTLKMSFNSVYPEIYNMLDWTRSNLFECYAAVQMSDPATSMRTSVPLRVNVVGRAKSFPLGSLEPGKLADMVVLGDNPLAVDKKAIRDIPVLATIVGNELVYGSLE